MSGKIFGDLTDENYGWQHRSGEEEELLRVGLSSGYAGFPRCSMAFGAPQLVVQ